MFNSLCVVLVDWCLFVRCVWSIGWVVLFVGLSCECCLMIWYG